MPDDPTPTTTTVTTEPAATPVDPAPKTFSQDYVEQLRGEAAKARTDKKAAVDAAKETVREEFSTKYEALKAEFATKQTALEGQLATKQSEWESQFNSATVATLKLKAAITTAFGDENGALVLSLSDLLKGSTEEEIKASATSAAKLFGGFKTNAPATDPTQGSGGGSMPLNGDPIMNALKQALRIN